MPLKAAESLRDELAEIIRGSKGRVGVALISPSGDTLTVGDDVFFPLMSVFKLHQAVALCEVFGQCGTSLDSLVTVNPSELNRDTWSPVLGHIRDESVKMSVGELMRASLVFSDNNASNLMFGRLLSSHGTDSVMAALIPRGEFRIEVTEEEMGHNHMLSKLNRSSAYGVAVLLDRLFADSILQEPYRQFVKDALYDCATGADRIARPLAGIDGLRVAHKTGSGFRDGSGLLTAHNDAACVVLPDGSRYILVVLVRDFDGDEAEASAVASSVSAAVYRWLAVGEGV